MNEYHTIIVSLDVDLVSSEAAVRRCSAKLMFFKILQIAQESTCVGVSFNKAFRPATF